MMKWMATFVGLFICSLAAAQPATQPVWREKFDAAYSLVPDQVLKHIQPPLIDERMEFFTGAMPEQAALMSAGPNVMVVSWADQPSIWMCRFSGGDDHGITFGELLSSLTHLRSYEIVVEPELGKQELKGDWSLRNGTDPIKLLARCAAIVGSETNQKISVTREIVEQEAIVAKGTCSAEPQTPQKKILLPLNELALCRPLMGNGARRNFYDQLAEATGYPVFDSNESDTRDGFFEWGLDGELDPPGRVTDRVSSESLDALLKSISDQTSLTFAIEPRKITRWRVTMEK